MVALQIEKQLYTLFMFALVDLFEIFPGEEKLYII